jgi:hypothetical protein
MRPALKHGYRRAGQFIEYLCGLTPSMFAEKVFDGGFERVPDHKVAFRRETDRIERPWYPDGAVNRRRTK